MPWPPRLPDWHRRLAAYLATEGARPFAEGTHDCALFVGGAVEAMTGADPMVELRGRYRTTAEGLALLRDMGVSDHLDWYGRRFPRLRQGERLRPGDIACLPGHDGPSLGIVQGEAVYVLRPDAGMGLAPLSDVLRGWRVG